eukprot:TRINITY_DN12915_c1_g1_i1.p1 TRINITY_DN12915_c1_g1~~TRINITY_DN12915_c1_g1_i1.p1  ORF type:complete len:901 (+),score=102.60 TRINITY_DN12915_c1_g1_i1:108-2810(+)
MRQSRKLLGTLNQSNIRNLIGIAESQIPQHVRLFSVMPLEDIEGYEQPQEASYIKTTQQTSSTLPLIRQLHAGESLRDDVKIGTNKIEFEVGNFARVANGSCVTTVGNTKLLATAVMEEESGFFVPTEMQLYVDFRTPSYAIGRIPFTPTKREGAPTDTELMALSAVDKSIRPLFPPGFFHKLQVQVQVLSADGMQDPTVHAINAASQALMCSDIPWGGPVGAVRVCRIRDTLRLNPSLEDQEVANLNLIYVATADDKVVMLQADGKQVPDNVLVEAVNFAHEHAKQLLQPQIDLAKRSGLKKRAISQLGTDYTAYRITSQYAEPIVDAILDDQNLTLADQLEALNRARAVITEKMFRRGAMRREQIRVPGSGCASNRDLAITFEMCLSDAIRRRLFSQNLRLDNRAPEDLKKSYAQIDAVPIVHGSAFFQQGETQSLTTCTVGGRSDILREQTIIGFSTNRLIANVGQSGYAQREVTYRGPLTQEEIQAGQLVQSALEPLMPSPMVFPFPARINSEVLSLGGSALSTAICGGALALRNAGVPIQTNIAAVNVGFVHERYPQALLRELPEVSAEFGYDKINLDMGRCEFLMDMSALEERICDANMTLAATHNGICAVNYFANHSGMPIQTVVDALSKGYQSRTDLLTYVNDVQLQKNIEGAGDRTSRFGSITIDKDNVTRLIGIGGTNIRRIIEKTDCRILVDASGEVKIYAPTKDRYDEAVALVKEVDGSIEVGTVVNGKITNVTSFGVFVELPNMPSSTGALLHVSEVAHDRKNQTTQGFKVGEALEVKVIGKDAKGNFQLSRKALAPISPDPQVPEDLSYSMSGQEASEKLERDNYKLSQQGASDDYSSENDYGKENVSRMMWDDPWQKSNSITYLDRKSTRLNSSHQCASRMPSSA